MIPALEELQHAFKSYLMHRDAAIANHIVSSKDLSNDLRLAIYSNAYSARLIEALEQDFEVLLVLLGEEEFTELASRYINTYPSKFFSLRWFGQYMAQFIGNTKTYNNYPYLQEMAEFEWSFIEAFDAEDISTVSETDAASVPAECWPDLIIQLHPSLQCMDYQWNVLPVWNAIKNEQPIPEFVQLEQKTSCIVWRHGLKTHFRSVEPVEAELMRHTRMGANFAQLCERLLNLDPDNPNVAMQAATVLRTWINQGLVAKLLY